MNVWLQTDLTGCPETCQHLDIETETITSRVMGSAVEVVIVATCMHSNVCKLREDHICNGAAASADATSAMSR